MICLLYILRLRFFIDSFTDNSSYWLFSALQQLIESYQITSAHTSQGEFQQTAAEDMRTFQKIYLLI